MIETLRSATRAQTTRLPAAASTCRHPIVTFMLSGLMTCYIAIYKSRMNDQSGVASRTASDIKLPVLCLVHPRLDARKTTSWYIASSLLYRVLGLELQRFVIGVQLILDVGPHRAKAICPGVKGLFIRTASPQLVLLVIGR
jgi:hypothetical protein